MPILAQQCFSPYALDLAAMGFSSAHISQSLAFLVLLRNDGALLALPELAMPGEALAAGEPTDTSALVGPHLKVELGAAMLDEVSILQEPVPMSDRSISAELVDFSSEVLQYMRALDSAQELMDLLAFDFREPLLVPSPGGLVARALDWARGDLANVGERIQFYSADDVPVTPLPHEGGADTPRELRGHPAKPAPRRKATAHAGSGGGGDAGLPKKRPTVATLARSIEEISLTLPSLVTQVQELASRTAAMEETTNRASDRTSALRRPIGSLTLPGSGGPSPLRSLVSEMPPPKSMAPAKQKVVFNMNDTEEMLKDLPEATPDFARAMLAQSQALTALVAQIANGSGDPFHDLGSASSSLSSKGSLGRAKLQAELAAHKGTFFCERASEHVEEDVPGTGCRGGDVNPEGQGCHPYSVPGEVRRLWSYQGHRLHYLASCSVPQLHAGGQFSGSKRRPEPPLCLPGTDCNGQWKDGGGTSFGPGGGSATLPILREVGGDGSKPEALCSNSKSTMGDHRIAVPEGDGCDLYEEGRGDSYKELSLRSDSKCTGPEEEGQRKGGEGEGIPPKRSTRGGMKTRPEDYEAGDLDPVPPHGKDEDQLRAEISCGSLFSSLIRWVLRSRTPFAFYLARSFHACRSGLGPTTAVLPLPIPYEGLFEKQWNPKLSKAKWDQLCKRRALHVLLMAVNYIHNGLKPTSVASLGRRPSLAQVAVFRRLQALLAACDQPGARYPLPPGRSGCEFIARLVELEKFACSSSVFNFDYQNFPRDDGGADQKVGEIEKEHYFRVEEKFSPMRPYRALEVSRLKLSGQGQWDMQEYIEGCLWLPFQDPSVLWHGNPLGPDGPNLSREDPGECLRLARLWDARGLLAMFHRPHPSGLACRVFNAHKNELVDRQIGDRRWFNAAECHPRGPSAFLPSGHHIVSLHCPPGYKLVGCAADRKDFYHQARVSRERAFTNLLPFEYEVDGLCHLQAWTDMLAEGARPVTRETHGDRYGMPPATRLKAKNVKKVSLGFKSLYQGDHLGVEFALESHSNLLRRGGLLEPSQTILGHHTFPKGPCWQGLVIDDYFAISREKAGSAPLQAESVRLLAEAEGIYKREGVLGSDDKTVRGAEFFKVVGAEIWSDSRARGVGIVSVAAPLSKRIPMIALSLRAAALPVVSRTLASRLAGNWISVLMFRRCLCCVLSRIFALGNKSAGESNEVLTLSRATAEELVLASIVGLAAATDVSVPYDEAIYATDASNQKGAVTKKTVGKEISEVLWLGGDKKGAYTMLDTPARSILRAVGEDCDESPLVADFDIGPSKVIPFEFDFVEIFGGAGVLSEAAANLGLIVCTPIDLSRSPHHDVSNAKLVDWIFQMIFEKRFKSLACEPPCTTFSPAQHPASRSYKEPLGFNRRDPKTRLGNMLAFRSFAILWFAWRCGTPSLLETPHLSKMAWLPSWSFLLGLGFEEAVLNSCAFGSIHKKAFRLLGWGLEIETLRVPCPGNHSHVRIEGKYTKASAVYHPQVAAHIAKCFQKAVRRLYSFEEDSSSTRLESIVVNDLLVQDGWSTLADWAWKRTGHINVLESRAFVALERRLLEDGGDRRFVALLDSRVAKGAHAKGRSSALALRPSLLRSCSYQVAGNLYPSYGFAPTRLNTADAPSRDKDFPMPAEASITDALTREEIATLHSHQFSRTAANWIRLYLLVVICLCPGATASAVDRPSSTLNGFWTSLLAWSLAMLLFVALCRPHFASGLSHDCSHTWTSSWSAHRSGRSIGGFGTGLAHYHTAAIWGVLQPAGAMTLRPENKEEEHRAHRRSGTTLQADRVVLQSTRCRRDLLLAAFDRWLGENMRTTLEALLEPHYLDPERVSEALISYGKDLYNSGKAYGRFSETINAVTSRRPSLRRQVAACWDLAFNCVVDEPHEHNAALPQSILVAIVGLALLWGWCREGALFALGWTGVLRIGEIFGARREDLILPRDAAPGVQFALLKIKLPKTRGRAARHQSARVEPSDVVALLDATFAHLLPSEFLWDRSPSALRKRFSVLQAALGLDGGRGKAGLPYSLSSLRPGGATYWLQATEDAEYVRRKGRWLSTRVLEVYLQETTFATYTQKMSGVSQSRVYMICSHFNEILLKAIAFKEAYIPECAWPRLW